MVISINIIKVKITETFNYRDIPIYILEDDDENLYIPMNCVRRALGYGSSGQLSRMRSRHPEIEYVKDIRFEGYVPQEIKNGGVYTLDGVSEVCSHTQKFRDADVFLDFLMKELGNDNIKSRNFPEPGMFEKTERELLIAINLHLARIENLISCVYERLSDDESKD